MLVWWNEEEKPSTGGGGDSFDFVIAGVQWLRFEGSMGLWQVPWQCSAVLLAVLLLVLLLLLGREGKDGLRAQEGGGGGGRREEGGRRERGEAEQQRLRPSAELCSGGAELS